MNLSIEDIENAARTRAGGRCEYTYFVGEMLNKHQERCVEVQGRHAVNYKGRVNLSVVRMGKKNDNRLQKLKVYCWPHALKKELAKKKQKPKPRKIDENQADIFLGIAE